MKDNHSTEDEFFKEIMSDTRLTVPFKDFEDCVMAEIENRVINKSKLSKEIKLSWVFFVAGSLFGIILSGILIQIKEPVFGINPINLTIVFAIVFAGVIFSQIDILLKFSNKMNSKER
jgi:uncharacterized protein with PQ loop repeat